MNDLSGGCFDVLNLDLQITMGKSFYFYRWNIQKIEIMLTGGLIADIMYLLSDVKIRRLYAT